MAPTGLFGVQDARGSALAAARAGRAAARAPSHLPTRALRRRAAARRDRAGARQPVRDVLLADEPTGNLDTKTGEAILALLYHLWREEGLTVVLITHDTAIAAEASRVVHLGDGRITSDSASGAEADTQERPLALQEGASDEAVDLRPPRVDHRRGRDTGAGGGDRGPHRRHRRRRRPQRARRSRPATARHRASSYPARQARCPRAFRSCPTARDIPASRAAARVPTRRPRVPGSTQRSPGGLGRRTAPSQETPSFLRDDRHVSPTAQDAGPRILVVDDELNIAELISMALRYEGFEVETAGYRRGGARRVRALPPAADRARRDAARLRRLRGRAPARRHPLGGPDHLPRPLATRPTTRSAGSRSAATTT